MKAAIMLLGAMCGGFAGAAVAFRIHGWSYAAAVPVISGALGGIGMAASAIQIRKFSRRTLSVDDYRRQG